MTVEYDLVVLGGGTGGYVAAIRASQLGMKVAIVEQHKLGGTCLHHGCIPTKTVLQSASLYRQLKQSASFGLEHEGLTVHFNKIQERKQKVVQSLHDGIQTLMKKHTIDVYYGFGRILGPSLFSPVPGTISVEHENGEDNTMLLPKQIIIATGSEAKSLGSIPFDGKYILNSDQLLQLDELPTSIIIVGAGVIGIEFASMLQDLGVQVTVLENNDHILTSVDDDVRRELQKSLKKRGVIFLTGATIDNYTIENDEKVTMHIQIDGKKEEVHAEKVLISIGRTANISEIGLNNTAIEIDNGVIKTNEYYQTKESHIYAIGDCIGGMQLAHVASAEGIVAVEHMAKVNPLPINDKNIPACIYSYPEIAQIGLTEKNAKEQGYAVKVGKFPFQAIGKAHVIGDTLGFVKMIIDEKTDDILGVHMIGPHVTDMISEASLAKMLDATALEMYKTIHPHPALSEIFVETALAVDNIQIHG